MGIRIKVTSLNSTLKDPTIEVPIHPVVPVVLSFSCDVLMILDTEKRHWQFCQGFSMVASPSLMSLSYTLTVQGSS